MNRSLYRTRTFVAFVCLGYSLYFFFWKGDYFAGGMILLQSSLYFYAAGGMLQGSEALQWLVPDLKKHDSYEFMSEMRRFIGLAFLAVTIIAFQHDNAILGISFWIVTLAMTHPLERFFFAPMPIGHPDNSLQLVAALRTIGCMIAIVVAFTGIYTSSSGKNGWALTSAGMILAASLFLWLKGNPHFSKKTYYRDAGVRTLSINGASRLTPAFFQLLILDYQVEWLESRDYWKTLAQQADREAFKTQTIQEILRYSETIRAREPLQHRKDPGVSVLDEIADAWQGDRSLKTLFNATKAWCDQPGSRKLSAVIAHVAEYRAMNK